MKVLFIEDDSRIWGLTDVIKSMGHDVDCVDNLYSANKKLKEQSGEYGAILLDLALDGRDLSEPYMRDMVADGGFLPGHVFFKEVLKKEYGVLAERTIFLTGVANYAKRIDPPWYEEYSGRIILKTDSTYKERINELLLSFDA